MQSEKFNPKFRVEVNTVKDLFKETERQELDIHTTESPEDLKPDNN